MQSIVWQSMSNASQATSHASQATSNASQAMSNASQATSNASQATSKHIFTRSRDPEILVFLQVWPGVPGPPHCTWSRSRGPTPGAPAATTAI